MAFINSPTLPILSTRTRTPAPFVCSQSLDSNPESAPSVTRRQLLSNAALAAAAAIASTISPSPANAGIESAISKTFFPKQGFNVPDTVAPSSDLVDRDLLGKSDAKAALSKLRDWDNSILTLYAKFQEDPQLELSSSLRKFSISDLRNALNIVNEAIDETTQIQTDKVVRGIIQDIAELQNSAALKPGIPRTPKKINRTTDWFVKLTGDFKRLLSFYV